MPTSTAPVSPDAAEQRLSEWHELQSEKARLHAREADLLCAAFGEALDECETRPGMDDLREIPIRSLIAEYSAAGRISSRTMEATMWNAYALVTQFPLTFQALEDARITPTHARIIADAGASIDDQEKRFAYELAAVDYASGKSPNRVRSVARMLAAKHGGVTFDERRKAAHDQRTVWVDDFDDGSAVLHILTSSVLAHAARDRASQLARLAKDPHSGDTPHDDPRTMDQTRADVMIDLLLAAAAETVTASGAEAVQGRVQGDRPISTDGRDASLPARPRRAVQIPRVCGLSAELRPRP